MSVFHLYARYYDLLYKDKDYIAEGAYVHRLIQKYMPGAKTILELGCGTGIHAGVLAELGYRLHGIDQSTEMLEAATQRASRQNSGLSPRLSFSQGDICTVRMDRKFDVVISLFHVLNYLTTEDGLSAALTTAKAHLDPGGIFIFDFWYGPAVLHQQPALRVKRLEDDQIQVTRIAEPVMRAAENIVDVNYQVFIRHKADGKIEELRETHCMRYLFDPEIDAFLAKQGMTLLDRSEWMTGRQPGPDTWGVCCVVRG